MIVTRGIYTEGMPHPCFKCGESIFYRDQGVLVSRKIGDGTTTHRSRFHPACFDSWILANMKYELSQDQFVYPRRRRP